MNKAYSFAGGRKIFWGFLAMIALTIGAHTIEEANYKTYQAGIFAIYASMVLGNVGTKFIYAKNDKK